MKSTKSLACALSLGVLLCACRASGAAVRGGHDDPGSTGSHELGDPELARDLLLESIQTERDSGRLRVQFDLRNRRDERLPLEWTLTWLDAGGIVLDTPRTWTHAVLGASDVETLSLIAPTPLAAGFKLGVREPSGAR